MRGICRSDTTRSKWLPYWSEDAAGGFVINGSVFERDIRNKVGSVDVIVALTGLFHERNPLGTLRRLAYLTNDYLLLYSTVVAPFDRTIGSERVRFAATSMWPATGLSLAKMAALEAYWRERGVQLAQFERLRSGLPNDIALEQGGWWWFFGEQAIEKLLERAGLEVVETAAQWEMRGRSYLARKKRRT